MVDAGNIDSPPLKPKLGHGNITVGGVQLERDGELTDAGATKGSALIGINRNTEETEKTLWDSSQSQTVDATLDHRLLSEDGRKEIKQDVKDSVEAAKAGIDKIKTEFDVITTNLPEDKKHLGPLMEQHLNELVRNDNKADAERYLTLLDEPQYQEAAMALLNLKEQFD